MKLVRFFGVLLAAALLMRGGLMQALTTHLLIQKPITIVIPSYNNAMSYAGELVYKKNLDSILGQEYDNFHVVYIDDCSPDGTGLLVKEYLENHPKKDRVTLILNQERRGALMNRYHVFHAIPDDHIIAECDGDDWYAHPRVLARINQEYQDPNVWLTYGQFMRVPNMTIGQCKPLAPQVLANQLIRNDGYYTSMLRTYYAWLYKKIKLQDLMVAGNPIETCSDVAIMVPMVEMAGKHCRFIDEILYIVNRASPLNTEYVTTNERRDFEHRVVWQYRSKYAPLIESPVLPQTATYDVAALIIAEHGPDLLERTLISFAHYAKNIAFTCVVYQSNLSHGDAYDRLVREYPHVVFIPYTEAIAYPDGWRSVLGAVATLLPCSYVLLTSNDWVLTKPLDVLLCAQYMQQTQAYGFYVGMGSDGPFSYTEQQELPPFVKMPASKDNAVVSVWQFLAGSGAWQRPQPFAMVLYARHTILHMLQTMVAASTPNTIADLWGLMNNWDGIGLCLQNAHAIRR